MTTHSNCDHENTKAARAKCRRGKPANELPKMSAEEKARVKANKPAVRGKQKASTTRRVDKPINTSLPHEFDQDMERPGRCYVCKLTPTARVHTAALFDLSARL